MQTSASTAFIRGPPPQSSLEEGLLEEAAPTGLVGWSLPLSPYLPGDPFHWQLSGPVSAPSWGRSLAAWPDPWEPLTGDRLQKGILLCFPPQQTPWSGQTPRAVGKMSQSEPRCPACHSAGIVGGKVLPPQLELEGPPFSWHPGCPKSHLSSAVQRPQHAQILG